jgi:hypothetical protein
LWSLRLLQHQRRLPSPLTSALNVTVAVEEARGLAAAEHAGTYATLQCEEGGQVYATPLAAAGSAPPAWRHEHQLAVRAGAQSRPTVTFQVYAAPDNVLLGTAVVHVGALLRGMPEVHGWYHLADGAGRTVGQLKVRIAPQAAAAPALAGPAGYDSGRSSGVGAPDSRVQSASWRR